MNGGWLGPVPGQEFVETSDRMVGDAGEHVGEPSLGVDVVELGGGDQAVDDGGALAAAVGAGKQPRLAAECDAAQRPLGGIVGEADPAVAQEAVKAGQRSACSRRLLRLRHGGRAGHARPASRRRVR